MMYMMFEELVMLVSYGELTEAEAETVAEGMLARDEEEWD